MIYNFAFGSSEALEVPIPRLCCARILRDGRTGWCWLADQHVGDHEGTLSVPFAAPSYGPRKSRGKVDEASGR